MKKTVLILGATGATGRLLVQQLLNRDILVKAVVRSVDGLPESIRDHENASVVRASVSDLGDAELRDLVSGCDAVASCLGHNLSFKGIYGKPRRLVTDAVRRVCDAIEANPSGHPIKVVLMNSAGCRNNDRDEQISWAQRCVIGLLRVLIPPHRDNENAAEFLRTKIGQDSPSVRWAVVRPDSLIDEDGVGDYQVYPSPTRSAIFNPGRTSRINVADFIAELIVDPATWSEWEGQMPVIYNAES